MYIVTVVFSAHEQHVADFRAAIADNAKASREREPGCRQFDVCVAADEQPTIFLYEVYTDRAAFDAHLASDHFKAFDALAAPWIRKKVVRIYERIDPIVS